MYKFEMQKYARFRAAVADRHIQVSPPLLNRFLLVRLVKFTARA